MNIIKLIKKYIFGIKENVIVEKKPKIRIKVKAGSEEWYKKADDFTKQEYYSACARKADARRNEENKKLYEKLNKRKLQFELVPKSQSNRNVRSYLEYTTDSFEKWAFIRNNEEKKSNEVCCICGCNSLQYGKTYNTECHEVWDYNFTNKTQYLIRLEALCVLCHRIKHLDNQSEEGEERDNMLQYYAIINDITIDIARKDFERALKIKLTIDNVKFTKIDLSPLENEYGIVEKSFNCHSEDFNYFLENVFKKKKK